MMLFFFFNDTATTEIYTLSLHDALPIYAQSAYCSLQKGQGQDVRHGELALQERPYPCTASSPGKIKTLTLLIRDRKSTRLNSSHANISYAVFCLKKKKKQSQYIIISIY